jgi:hypothetical protein
MNDPAQYRYGSDKLGFYIAASDQDLLGQVNRLMSRSGYVGVMDTAGRLQYLVDGRRGSPHAARRIVETTGRILRDQADLVNPLLLQIAPATDRVLATHAIRPELKGYRYLRYMLLQVGLDETSLRPVSKTLYPAAASHFRTSISQIERDIRYAMQKTDLRQQGLTCAAAICRLYDEVMRLAESMQKNETPPAIASDNGGRY